MQSVFSLFENYEDGRLAVDELLDEGFDEEEMNVIVDAEVAKTHMDVNLERVAIKATDELGEETTGLGIMLGTEQPVAFPPPLGDVYAAGDLATILAKTAAEPGSENLEKALEEFGIPRSMTAAYVEALTNGALLFWMRTSDEQATRVSEILRVHGGTQIVSYDGT
jgi:hypothetical protein